MSGESALSDVALTRRAFALADAGDFDAILDLFCADAVWDVTPWGLGSHTGRRAIRRFLESWMGSFESYEVTVQELADLGNGVVVARATQHARSPRTREPLRLRYAPVFVWRDGLIARVTHYRSVGEAKARAELLAGSAS